MGALKVRPPGFEPGLQAFLADLEGLSPLGDTKCLDQAGPRPHYLVSNLYKLSFYLSKASRLVTTIERIKAMIISSTKSFLALSLI